MGKVKNELFEVLAEEWASALEYIEETAYAEDLTAEELKIVFDLGLNMYKGKE